LARAGEKRPQEQERSIYDDVLDLRELERIGKIKRTQ